MAMKDWLQGTWSCTATDTDHGENSSQSEDLVVVVEAGTWAITSVTNPDGWGVMEPTNGTWSLSPAGLQVDVDYHGASGGLIPGLPETTEGLHVTLADLVWSDNDAGPLSIVATKDQVTLTEDSIDFNGHSTETVCTKD